MKIVRFWIIVVIAAAGFGCTRYTLEAPEGFAEVEKQKPGSFLAVSPEGMRFSITTEKNYPRQDLDYWQTAMGEHMEKAGYTLLAGPGKFETEKREGVFYEWAAPYLGKDYVYLTGLIVSGKRLLVIEAAGEYGIYQEYSENIKESLTQLSVR